MSELATPQSESERVLRWYTLVQDVYDLAAHGSASSAELFDAHAALLERAASYFGLQALQHCQGPPPAPSGPGELVFPLPPRHGGMAGPSDDAAYERAKACDPEAGQHYLRAHAGAADPGPTLRAQLQRFVQHLERCIHVLGELATARRSVEGAYAALDRQELAVVLCDAHGRPCFASRAAVRLQAQYAELQLGLQQTEGTLRTRHPLWQLRKRFRDGLRQGESRAVQLVVDSLVWTLVPLLGDPSRAAFVGDGPAFGVIVRERPLDGEQPAQCGPGAIDVPHGLGRRLRARWGLTPAEARLCFGLSQGLSVARYAARVERSPLTARKQLKSIFRKLQVVDQKSLILRIWQEQQIDWVECVTVVTPEASSAAAWSLVYPRSRPTHASGKRPEEGRLSALGPENHGVHD